MAVIIDIDATDLVRFIQNLDKAPLNVQKAATDAINRVGDSMVEDVIEEIADETGLSESTIRRALSITKARPHTMAYRIDASSALIEAPESRPMRGRREFAQRSSSYFHADEMVDVVTMGDDKVCPICVAIANEGPYRIDEARTLIPAHPHCRCLVQPTRPKRTLPVRFRKGAPARTGEQVVEKLYEELKAEIQNVLDSLYGRA